MRELKRSRTMAAGLGLTAVTLLAQVVVGATAAEARCINGTPTRSTLGSIPTSPVLEEEPLRYANGTSTCDGDRTYRGRIRAIPGSPSAGRVDKIQVWIQNGGHWSLKQNYHGAVGTWADVAYADENSNVWMVLCWIEPEPVRTPHCGWGTNVETQSPPATFFDTHPTYHGVSAGF